MRMIEGMFIGGEKGRGGEKRVRKMGFGWTPLMLLVFLICSSLFAPQQGVRAESPTGDGSDAKMRLLNLKKSIYDPLNVLDSWVQNSSTFCTWSGITCDNSSTYVLSINLSSKNLSGFISPEIGQLTTLQELRLGYNNFSGKIPDELTNCSSLRYLNLTDNSFLGTLPLQLWQMPNLEIIVLWNNLLEGSLPAEIGFASKLKHLDLGGNQLEGDIPSQIGNLSYLQNLTLAGNYLEGEIPISLGGISRLEWLYLGYNQLSGSIPPELGLLPNLNHLDLVFNNLTGAIPDSLQNLTKLQYLFLYSNKLLGEIPPTIGNLRQLISLDLSNNSLSGEIPRNLSGLKNLQILNLFTNNLVGEIPNSLVDLPSLQILALWQNQLSGIIPPNLGLNSSLTVVDLSTNHLMGSIPLSFCVSGNLYKLILFDNLLSGRIPESLGNCSSLKRVRIQNNSFSGNIPAGIWTLPLLYYLDLSSNNLSGLLIGFRLHISSDLQVLQLQNNQLSGEIPLELGSLSNLVRLDLSENRISGEIPSQLGNLSDLSLLDLSGNVLSGHIPSSLSACKKLLTLKLQKNELTGEIPPEIASMQALGQLDLSQNHLTGRIPPKLGSIIPLDYLNLSYNDLSGAIPVGGLFTVVGETSVMGNAHLCGDSSLGLRACSDGDHQAISIAAWIVALGFSVGVTAALVYYYSLCRRHQAAGYFKEIIKAESSTLVLYESGLPLGAAEVVESVREENLVIKGASSDIFKGVMMKTGHAFAVKKYFTELPKTEVFEELQLLATIRHPSVVRLIGFCFNSNTNLLVYEFMANGSLLHGLIRSEALITWQKRAGIAVDVARALAYLHSYKPPILLGSFTSEDILLDEKFAAHLLLKPNCRMITNCSPQRLKLANSVHAAPDEADNETLSKMADVYSFGEVLLELITGKRRADFADKHAAIIDWAHKASMDRTATLDHIVDPSLRFVQQQRDKAEIWQFLQLASLCTKASLSERPSMQEAAEMLASERKRVNFFNAAGSLTDLV